MGQAGAEAENLLRMNEPAAARVARDPDDDLDADGDPDAENYENPPGVPSVEEMISMDIGDVEQSAAVGGDDPASRDAGTAAKEARGERRGFSLVGDAIALEVRRDKASPTGCYAMPFAPQDEDLRRSLGSVMMGAGSPIHRLLDGSKMSQMEGDAARAVAHGLAGGLEGAPLDVVLLSQMAAASYIAFGRLAAGASRFASEQRGSGAKGALDCTRGMATVGRTFVRLVEAVELAGARARQSTAIPRFVVRGIARGAELGTGEKQAG